MTLSGLELPTGLSECRSYQVLHLFFAVAMLPSGKFVEVWLRQFRSEEAHFSSKDSATGKWAYFVRGSIAQHREPPFNIGA